jgi:hypothetical protein
VFELLASGHDLEAQAGDQVMGFEDTIHARFEDVVSCPAPDGVDGLLCGVSFLV